MSTESSNTTGDTPRPSAVQIRLTTSDALASADAGATETLSNLKTVHQARLNQLKRTAATLLQQYGPNDPTVKAAEASVAVGVARLARISAVHEQVATTPPQVSATGWALHGRAFNPDGQPVAKLTVFLVDASKTFQEQFGFAYTDSTGYFLINYGGNPAAAKAKSANNRALFVQIADAAEKPIYLATAPFQPTPGSVTYQNITLAAVDSPLGDPPPVIRRTAFPKV